MEEGVEKGVLHDDIGNSKIVEEDEDPQDDENNDQAT